VLEGIDLVVLARYMRILSGDFLARLGVPVIGVHHSFRPAFSGAGPYERAHDRGVKLIGATAHYVTEVERTVLARAVRGHLEDRVVVAGPRTVVF